jgi:hypothetical protein
MALVAPRQRQQLSADARLRVLRRGFAAIPAYRLSETDMALPDALMAALARLSLQSPALLAVDKHRVAGNVGTIDALDRVPCDTQRRARLDPVSPDSVRPLCQRVCGPLQRGTALASLLVRDDASVLARDGTASFSSTTMHCAACLHQVHRHGSITSDQHMLGAALVHPDQRAVIPLRPAPLIKHDGPGKKAGERHAAHRFMATWRQDHPHLQCVVTADRLRANAPHSATLHAHGLHAMLGVQDGEPASLCAQGPAAEQAGRVPA